MGVAGGEGQRRGADLYRHAAERLRRSRGSDVQAMDRFHPDGPPGRTGGGGVGGAVPGVGRRQPDDRQRRGGGWRLYLLLAGVELGGTKCVWRRAWGPDDIRAEVRIDTTTPAGTVSAIQAVVTRWHR